jgi:transmembrane sensor
MAEWLEDVSRAREHVSPQWTPTRERAARFNVERGLGRRRAYVKAFGGVVLAVVTLFLGRAAYERVFETTPSMMREAARRAPELLQLTDGTHVTGVSANARVEPLEISEHLVTLRLLAGSAHFDVAHRKDRPFRVRAGDVTVTVLGTAFTVELTGEAVRVHVDRGRVDVAWTGTHRELAAGEELLAPSKAPQAAADAVPTADMQAAEVVSAAAPLLAEATDPQSPTPAPASASAPPHAGAANGRSWRTLAQEGDYRSAFTVMSESGPSAVRDEPDDLLFAADVARLSGHPDLAVPKLERVLRAHSRDSRAPLAAFTLGRTLLDSLGRPREAAEVFAKARKLSPGGALAQDALAREVESWSRAGESALARTRALEYLKLYPDGRREKAVRFHGGLE